jgi:hypothetical protein
MREEEGERQCNVSNQVTPLGEVNFIITMSISTTVLPPPLRRWW